MPLLTELGVPAAFETYKHAGPLDLTDRPHAKTASGVVSAAISKMQRLWRFCRCRIGASEYDIQLIADRWIGSVSSDPPCIKLSAMLSPSSVSGGMPNLSPCTS